MSLARFSSTASCRQASKGIPLGRYGVPDDVGPAVVFLASDEASWITGQILSVNGGVYRNV